MQPAQSSRRAEIERPYISVVVTAFRRKEFLRESVESVLRQEVDRAEFEVIVVKDFTDADLDAWLGGLAPTVRVITAPLPLSGEMLATGVEAAQGEVVCFLDDDDRYAPGKLSGLLDLFRSDAQLTYVHSRCTYIDRAGRPLPDLDRLRAQQDGSINIDSSSPNWNAVSNVVRLGLPYYPSAMAFRTRVLKGHLDWLRRVPAAQDQCLFMLAAIHAPGRLRADEHVWCEYRVHRSVSRLFSGASTTEASAQLRVEIDRNRIAMDLINELASGLDPDGFAARCARWACLENRIGFFLIDPESSFGPGEWLDFILYLARIRSTREWRLWGLLLWAQCPLRWLAPRRFPAAFARWRQSRSSSRMHVD